MGYTGIGLALGLALAAPVSAWAQAAEWPPPSVTDGTALRDLLAGQPFPRMVPLDAAAPRTFGPTSEVAHVVPASRFESATFADPWTLIIGGAPTVGLLRVPGAPITLWAGIRLPAGARIARVELDGCDLDPILGEVSVILMSGISPADTTPLKVLGLGTTGAPIAPGCGLFPLAFLGGLTPADLTVDNVGHYYFLAVTLNSPLVAFSSVRVFYTLQVSPAPGAASFGDVPTSHPFFQFVEALVASGITSGCGGGNFCPDDPLTRGQMATFLAKGLGLHFAP
jgi:hypothetical protein